MMDTLRVAALVIGCVVATGCKAPRDTEVPGAAQAAAALAGGTLDDAESGRGKTHPHGVNSELELRGTVSQGTYWGLTGVSAQNEYRVDLVIKNTGSMPFTYDLILADFHSSTGRRLRQATLPLAGSTTLAPDEETEISYATDGYTQDLTRDDPTQPLMLVVELHYEERLRAGPFIAFLRPLRDFQGHHEPVRLDFLDIPHLRVLADSVHKGRSYE